MKLLNATYLTQVSMILPPTSWTFQETEDFEYPSPVPVEVLRLKKSIVSQSLINLLF